MNMKYVMLCLLIATQPPFPTDTMQLLVIKNPLICPAEKKNQFLLNSKFANKHRNKNTFL